MAQNLMSVAGTLSVVMACARTLDAAFSSAAELCVEWSPLFEDTAFSLFEDTVDFSACVALRVRK